MMPIGIFECCTKYIGANIFVDSLAICIGDCETMESSMLNLSDFR